MNGDLIKEIIRNFPNLLGLIVLSYVLWLINAQTNQRMDNLLNLLVNCFTSQGVIR